MTIGRKPKDVSRKMTLAQFREDVPVTKQVTYLQTGTYGPASSSVLKVVRDAMEYEARMGPASPASREELGAKEEEARNRVASLLNAKPEEVGIATNTTISTQKVFRSIRWQENDELIVSNLEHISEAGIFQVLERERGVIVKRIPADEGDAVFLEGVKASLTKRTKLVFVSHVSSPTGHRLPVAETADLAHEKGVPVCVDAAQSVGVIPVDVRALGCDLMVASGHKWLLGPMGTGMVFVASDQIPTYKPDFIPDYNLWLKPDAPRPSITARTRVEQGTHSRALVIGLGRAVENISNVGIDTIEAHVNRLSKTLREEVSHWNRVNVITPMEPGHAAGITTLTFDRFKEADLQALVTRLYDEDRILVKYQWLTAPSITDKVGMRISISAFNTEEEVQGLISALKKRLSLR